MAGGKVIDLYGGRVSANVGGTPDTGRGVPLGRGVDTGRGVSTGGMPSVPRSVQTGGMPPRANAESFRSASAYDPASLDALANAGYKMAGVLAEREDEEGRAWSASSISTARLDWSEQLVKRQADAEPGAPNFVAKFVEDFDKYSAETLANAPNDRAKNFMGQRLGDLRATLGVQAMQFEAQARIDYRTDQFNEGVSKAEKLMNTDPSQYETVMQEQISLLANSGVPPVKRSELAQRASDRISAAAVWSEIQRSPNGFLQAIGFQDGPDAKKGRISSGDLKGQTGFLPYDNLPFEKRIGFLEQALRLKSQIGADGDRGARELREQMREDAMKEGWFLQSNGKLTREYIESVRPVLNSSEYKALSDALVKPDTQKNDPGTFRQLETMISQGRIGEAQRFAFTSHAAGLISNETLSSTVSRAVALGKEGQSNGPKNEYERMRSYITGRMDPGPLVQDPVGRSRLADALYEYDTWYKAGAGGKRTDTEIRDFGKELPGRYKLIDFNDTVLTLPLPRSGNVRRNAADMKGMEQDLHTAMATARQRLADKQYTKADYDNEVATISRWLAAMKRAKQ